MLGAARQKYQPRLPSLLQDLGSVHLSGIHVVMGEKQPRRTCKPLRVGVLFSGGPAPGGHNVVTGLFDALKKLHPESRLFGFLDGPIGLMQGKSKELTVQMIDSYRNQGGFDLLGSGRDKIESSEQFAASKSSALQLSLDGLVIIGGDDSNTNAALLAEYFQKENCPTRVVGVPKTIDGDLQNECVQIPFGFDTACRTYCELIGNIARDALSSKKYYHLIKLMGRSASHVTLECALATHPNLTLISEEKRPFSSIVQEICTLISQRAEKGKNYGVILIPEGLIDSIPDKETIFAGMERDQHGNVNISSIETDLFVLQAVQKAYKGKLSPVRHFFGYEGRCALPSNFDANYCYSLGHVSALLINQGLTGFMSFVGRLRESPEKWSIGGILLSTLLQMEERKGKVKRVIPKVFVDLHGRPYKRFKQESSQWALEDSYLFPGPLQFFAEASLTDSVPHILQ